MSSRNAPIFDAQNPASPLSVPSANTALLLIDYHNAIVNMAGAEASTTIAQATVIREWARANGVLVAHCLIDTTQTCPSHYKSAERIKAMLASFDSQPGSTEEVPDIAFDNDAPREYVFKRTPGQISAFKSKDMAKVFDDQSIRSLIIAGISTSNCVLSTARAAGDEGYIVTVVEDACMDPVPGLHETMMKHVLAGQAHVTTTAEFIRQWSNVP